MYILVFISTRKQRFMCIVILSRIIYEISRCYIIQYAAFKTIREKERFKSQKKKSFMKTILGSLKNIRVIDDNTQ